ncbi:MAG: DNA-binding transcriptional ArsR family regulator [Candidatus Azotimanducaceae bacterium]|jgi:DNA-binding transcriptional ArsR family regulator
MNAHPTIDPTSLLAPLTSYCKATADQQRLMILRVLSRESFGVLELSQILNVAQPALSHHLKVLLTAELVETRRQGTSIYYRRALVGVQDPIRDLRLAVFNAVDQITPDRKILKGIETVHRLRHEHAREYFQKNSHRFQENQDLIAEYPHYAKLIHDLLGNEPLSDDADVVELGPGDCGLILDLACQFNHVHAVDNAEIMLDKTRVKVGRSDIDNVSFHLGELSEIDTSCDLLVLNMVLHHLATPAGLFGEAQKHLRSGGRLLIIDLCAHDQDWTREACGDLWLGFDPGELDNWAETAGLAPSQSAYLGLNNGFQIQVRTYSE